MQASNDTVLKISLKAARVNANLRQIDAANAIGVPKETIISWEKGKTSPKAEQLYSLAKLYSISIDNIFLPLTFT